MNVSYIGLSADNNFFFPMHSHDQWELTIFINGTGCVQIGNFQVPFTPGTIVCQPPGVLHSITGHGPYQDMCLRVERFEPPVPDAYPVFHDDGEKRFQTILSMMYDLYYIRQPNWANVIDALYSSLYQLLIGWSLFRMSDPVVGALVDEIIKNLSNPGFDLASRVAQTGYCPDHFRRMFRRATGATPAAYLTKLRLRHAQQLLSLPSSASFTVKLIALMSGFNDPYYFSTLFRRHVGMSPSEYATAARKSAQS